MFGLTTRIFDTAGQSARTDRASVFLTISVAGSSPAPLFGLALTRDCFTNLLLDFQWERALLFSFFVTHIFCVAYQSTPRGIPPPPPLIMGNKPPRSKRRLRRRGRRYEACPTFFPSSLRGFSAAPLFASSCFHLSPSSPHTIKQERPPRRISPN